MLWWVLAVALVNPKAVNAVRYLHMTKIWLLCNWNKSCSQVFLSSTLTFLRLFFFSFCLTENYTKCMWMTRPHHFLNRHCNILGAQSWIWNLKSTGQAPPLIEFNSWTSTECQGIELGLFIVWVPANFLCFITHTPPNQSLHYDLIIS